jgi:hypothetical protein
MSEQLSDQRLHELLDAAEGLEVHEGELHLLAAEVRERRRQSGYTREQRLAFLLRVVKDSFPEITNDLRKIYEEQNNDIYYSRRDREYWKAEYDKLKEAASD